MIRRRQQKEKQDHYCLLVNKSAAKYSERLVRKLTGMIRRRGAYYTVFEPDSANDLYHTTQKLCGIKRWHYGVPQQLSRRGQITSIIACGGDGTFNLVARVALKTDLPIGILPMGRFNNIARSLYGTDDADTAMKAIVKRNYRKIDTGMVAAQPFFGSVGVGYVSELSKLLQGRKPPLFGFGWSQLGLKAASAVTPRKIIIKIDSFRFEVSPVMFHVNLLSYAAGLPISPASISDDQRAEVILDFEAQPKVFASYTNQIHKRKYMYGSDIRLFRGKDISFQPGNGMMLYLDGELIEIPSPVVDISVSDKQLKVLC